MRIQFVLFVNLLVYVTGEYNIHNDIPSYMHKHFDNIKEDIFPRDLRIKLLLRRVRGTLLYSIDRRMNQLIISLNDIPVPSLDIEFRHKRFFITFSSLCGCKECIYVMLDLIIQIKEEIYLSCNGQQPKKFTYDNVIKFNKEYPLIYSNKSYGPINEAQLWLVNTPYDDGIYPNAEQLIGCIFTVSYNNDPVEFSKFIGKIDRKCSKMCVNDACNGGDCIENYNNEPLCNCTKTFLNGKFCNESLSSLNYKSDGNQFRFTVFKVSWNSSSQHIFSLSNKFLNFQLRHSGSILTFSYNYSKELSFFISSSLTQNYKPNKEYICVVTFNGTSVEIDFYNYIIWRHFIHLSYANLADEMFTSISLISGSGKIGFVYKTKPKTYGWKNIKPHNPREYVEKIKAVQNFNINNAGYYNHVLILMISVSLALSLFVIITMFTIKYLRSPKSRYIEDFKNKTWKDNEKKWVIEIFQKLFNEDSFKNKSRELLQKILRRICTNDNKKQNVDQILEKKRELLGTTNNLDQILEDGSELLGLMEKSWNDEERINLFSNIEKALKLSSETRNLLNTLLPSWIGFRCMKPWDDEKRKKVFGSINIIFHLKEFSMEARNLLKGFISRIFASQKEDDKSLRIKENLDDIITLIEEPWKDDERIEVFKMIEDAIKKLKDKDELLRILLGDTYSRSFNCFTKRN